MKIYLGNTDHEWFNYLSKIQREDINFWQPGGNTNFRILDPGGPFLFRLKSPINKIGGVGFFSSQTFLPIDMAWDFFEKGNGCGSLNRFKQLILQYRSDTENLNPTIGCIILTNPVFFKPKDWLDVPADWSRNIVQGKSYDTTTTIGLELWNKIEFLLKDYLTDTSEGEKSQLMLEEPSPQYGKSVLTKVRLGQGAFRVLVTDAYNRRCAISGERTLPVLEAAHIKKYAESGPHFISNALLLRSDIHKLFDGGYVTITKDLRVEVSKKIKEEFDNGREYYKFHGNELFNLPHREKDRPDKKFIEWHNSIFKG
ncbi:MAG: HNH endonuclease [Chitinophagales bacterium]